MSCFWIFLFTLFGSLAIYYKKSYLREMDPFIPEIEKIVNDILVEASKRLNDPKGIIRRIQALEVTLIKDTQCPPEVHMWTYGDSPSHAVFVCPRTIKSLLEYQNKGVFIYVAQHLIHESIHIIGYEDECVTTEIELILMNHSPYADDVYHNGYVDECGLSD